MGLVYTDITLRNALDVGNVSEGYIKESDVRQATLTAMVDTGAWTLAINEAVRQQLGLRIIGKEPGRLADGSRGEYDMAGPVEILWKNRRATCDALVLPYADDILLGAIPLEIMDLIVHPHKQELIGAHGDTPMHKV